MNLMPVTEVYAGALLLPAAVGAEAVRIYRDWAAGSGGVSSVVRFLAPAPIPTCRSRCGARRC